jgi:signal transduction histidine kinase
VHISVDPAADEVAISVRDFGSGVQSNELELIFEPFYRPAMADAGRPEGTGLGLAIARMMALAHGGSVRAANAGDGGLVVTIKLPRAPATS